jgi:aspartyl-tRNA(Asn)/glutamyl-tRNA(Gln) amidotransferase subunit A
MTILEAGRALRERKISSVELTKDALERIERSQPQLNAFITITGAAALSRAEVLDAELARGEDRGPLHGIPIAHKDAILTRGVRTTSGTKIFADHVPEEDAEIVTALDRAGAVTIGKTNLHELCHGITSNNPHYGAVCNPWDTSRIPGGSSGGSAAAVAAGLVPMATGTDTGGSIRIPASYCGVVGLKPTFGLLSCRGITPLGFTLDHVGPIARTVRDVAASFYAMRGVAAGQVGDLPHKLRVGVPENFFFDRLDPEVRLSVRKAVQTIAALGPEVTEIALPDVDALNTVGRLIQLAEASTVWKRYQHRRDDFGADVFTLLQQGMLISATDYLDAQRYRKMLARDFARVWERVDCLIMPATPVVAAKRGEMTVQIGDVTEDVRLASTRLTRPFNVLGWPALSLPCGFSEDGMPIGVQLAAAPHREELLLQAGAALEDVLGLTSRRAPASQHRPKLQFLHAENMMNPVKLESFRRLSTDAMKSSLQPGQAGALKTRPDGIVLDGHHRLCVLLERGEDIHRLPREIMEKE